MISGQRVSEAKGTSNTQIPKNKWAKSCEQFVEEENQKLMPIFKVFNFLVI